MAKKRSEHIQSIIDLFNSYSPDLNTIQEGVLIDKMPYKIELVSKGNILSIEGVRRGNPMATLIEASIEDNGYLTPKDIGRLFEAFKAKAKEMYLEAIEKEKEEARIQAIIDKEPKPRGGKRVRKEKKRPKEKKEKIKVELKETQAVRFNQDKVRFDLIPPEFIREIAEVLTFGATKYSPDNWKGFNKQQQEEIKASLLRHIYAYLEGEEFDQESGLHHLAHAGCNLAFLAYFRNKETK